MVKKEDRREVEASLRQKNDALIPLDMEIQPADAEDLHWFNERMKSNSKKNCTKCRGTGFILAWCSEGWNRKKTCRSCAGTGRLFAEIKLRKARGARYRSGRK